MQCRNRAFLSLCLLTIPAIAFSIGSGTSVGAPQGGHGGGAGHAIGGAAGGSFHGGWHGPYGYGGYRGYGGYGYGFGYPYYGYGFATGFGLGYGYPYYGYPAYVDPVYVDPGYGSVVATYPSTAMPSANPQSSRMTLNIKTPANAVIWINGEKTSQTGENREFVTAGLLPGRTYTFDIRAEWQSPEGKQMDVEKRIHVQSGDRHTLVLETATHSPQVVQPVHAPNP